jgi:hypothetical protein
MAVILWRHVLAHPSLDGDRDSLANAREARADLISVRRAGQVGFKRSPGEARRYSAAGVLADASEITGLRIFLELVKAALPFYLTVDPDGPAINHPRFSTGWLNLLPKYRPLIGISRRFALASDLGLQLK